NRLGALAVSTNLLCMFFTLRQSTALSTEYVKLLLITKTCLFFIPTFLFPCMGIFMKGIGAHIGISAHVSLVINLTILSMICAMFNCCLFHRHQIVLPFDHPFKLQPRGTHISYLIMNTVMIINPISFIFTVKDDHNNQLRHIEQSPMVWLLEMPAYKIYTDDNTPLILTFHFPLTVVTFGLCTLTTTLLTHHAAKMMNARRERISAATINMQQRLIKILQFQSSVDFILEVLRIRRPKPTVKPQASQTAFTISPRSDASA
ncbi:hypothetical protein PFISCL1PPCAC_16027, partial [Pristionchus fissidentatus]